MQACLTLVKTCLLPGTRKYGLEFRRRVEYVMMWALALHGVRRKRASCAARNATDPQQNLVEPEFESQINTLMRLKLTWNVFRSQMCSRFVIVRLQMLWMKILEKIVKMSSLADQRCQILSASPRIPLSELVMVSMEGMKKKGKGQGRRNVRRGWK